MYTVYSVGVNILMVVDVHQPMMFLCAGREAKGGDDVKNHPSSK